MYCHSIPPCDVFTVSYWNTKTTHSNTRSGLRAWCHPQLTTNSSKRPYSTMGERTWKYSTAIDPETVRQTGCFTTLPVRINNRDDIANAASSRVLKDWAAHTGNEHLDPNRVSFSPVGSFCSLIYCETIPERLDSISYLTDLFFLIDGSFHFPPFIQCISLMHDHRCNGRGGK